MPHPSRWFVALLGEKILALPGVADSRSYVVMEEVRETTVLPVL